MKRNPSRHHHHHQSTESDREENDDGFRARRLLHGGRSLDDIPPAKHRLSSLLRTESNKEEVHPLLQNIDNLFKKEKLRNLTERWAKEQRGAIISPWLFGGSSLTLFSIGYVAPFLEDDDDQQDLKNNGKFN